jgi:Rieske Fe-S protein
MSNSITRKNFIAQSCKGFCALVAGSAVMSMFESCSAFQVYKTNADKSDAGRVSMPLTEFATEKIKLLRVGNLDFDILVIQKSASEYTALAMKCTHQDWLLSANPMGLTCSSHGSQFDFDGRVTAGPATDPLRKFKTWIENNRLYIQ